MSILSPNKLYKDLDFSFTAHPNTGDAVKVVDNNSVKQSIKALLFTGMGERLFHPEIETPIRRLLFEPIDSITSEVLYRSIKNTIENYEPRVKLDGVQVVPNYEENSYEVSIFFTTIGVNQATSLTLTLQRTR